MRSDLNKVLCEHERYSSGDRYKNYRKLKKFNHDTNEDLENLPTREGMKKRYGYNVKQFSENLNALYGLVRKYVGRKWDDFYSDLCKNFDRRSVINQHILQHLDWYVERNIKVGNDGKLYLKTSNHYFGDALLEDYGADYYVDPRDNLIKKNKKKSAAALKKEREERELQEKAKVYRQLDENNVLRLIKGVWYHFEMKQLNPAQVTYRKPLGAETFNVTPGWSSKGKTIKTWDELNQKERERFGIKQFTNVAHDVFFGINVIFLHGSIYSTDGYKRINSEMVGKYHATKKTASHKLLKKAGLT